MLDRSPRSFFIAGLLLIVAAILMPVWLYTKQPGLMSTMLLQGDLDPDKVAWIADIIDRRYVDEVDSHELMREALKGMTRNLDPWTAYVEAQQKVELDRIQSGQLMGIGIQFLRTGAGWEVTRVFKNGPAAQAGMLASDRFIEIKGTNVEDLTNSQDIIDLIKGLEGTPVDLVMYRPSVNERISMKPVRGTVAIPSVEATLLEGNILHLRLEVFNANSEQDVGEALNEHDDLKALILDLRGNTGGLLRQAVNVAGLFLPKDSLVTVERYRGGTVRESRTKKEGHWIELPMIVLVDQGSASASEILAGCLQDSERAELWGQRTYGKGLVQETISLEEGRSLLKLTVARYETPKGRSVNATESEPGGLEPDVKISASSRVLNSAYVEAIRSSWETLEIPVDLDEFLKANPPARKNADARDKALEAAHNFFRSGTRP